MPSTFDQAAWHVNRTRLVNRVLDRFEGEGRSVSVEAQNQFTLVGRVATVGGRPDIIAVSGDSVTVCDAKTGQPRISDQVQVMAYMYAVPMAFPEYKGMSVGGLVIYEDHEVVIHRTGSHKITPALLARARSMEWAIHFFQVID